MPDLSLIAVGATACGIASALGWVEERAHRKHQQWCANAPAKAEGVVSRIGTRGYHSRNKPTESDTVHAMPIVRFRAANGVEYEVDAPSAPHEVGTPQQVAYDPASPTDARVVARPRKHGCAVVLLAAGIALLIFGIVR
ncbi:MAG TPA: DUF3592 domain-containing protein [Thermoanaerobaculia bacterium]